MFCTQKLHSGEIKRWGWSWGQSVTSIIVALTRIRWSFTPLELSWPWLSLTPSRAVPWNCRGGYLCNTNSTLGWAQEKSTAMALLALINCLQTQPCWRTSNSISIKPEGLCLPWSSAVRSCSFCLFRIIIEAWFCHCATGRFFWSPFQTEI